MFPVEYWPANSSGAGVNHPPATLPSFFSLCVVSCLFLVMQCIEPKEVWEAYSEDAEDPDCLFGTKHGRWKGLGGARGSVGAACVAAPGAGVCV